MAVGVKIPGIFDYNVTDTANTSSFWIEEIADLSPSVDEWSAKFARSTTYAYMPDDLQSQYDFINTTLGYAYMQPDKTIFRSNPIQHPKFPNLRATRITDSRGIKFSSKQTTGANDLKGPQTFAGYNRRLCAVEYAPCPYKIRSMEQITESGTVKEWKRNVQYNTEPNIYDVTIQVGNFTWAEGTANNPKDKQFPGEINFLEVKTTLELIWKLVPEEYIANTELGAAEGAGEEFPIPTKIAGAGGRVNSVAFDGKDIGVLLLLEPKIDRYLSGTLRATDNQTPVYMCDIILPLIHFDPPTYSTFKGHNTKPWWNKADNTFKYHLVTSDGATTGGKIYGSYDFKKIFEHWSA